MSCDIHGTIPDSIANWRSIQTISLGYNDFTGTVPSGICDIPTLIWLSVDYSKVVCSCCDCKNPYSSSTQTRQTMVFREHICNVLWRTVTNWLPEKHEDHFPELAHTYAIMHSLPAMHGFAPIRWQHCINAVLEKIPGQPLLERLRVIILFEADFNFMLKVIFGRRLMYHAEAHTGLGTDNHGCRAGRQVQDAILEKLLLYEFTRLSRTSLITVDNDAKSCFDRIIKTLAMLACIAYGLPLLAAVMHNKTHHGMKHSVKSRQ